MMKMKIEVKNFEISQIADSGECFRWRKIGESEYVGVIYGKICRISQQGNIVNFEGISEDEFRWYFDLEHDYSQIQSYYEKDPILSEAMQCGNGIRILNQEKFETLISFIISANNNIPRIKNSVETLAKRFGKRIDGEFYAFPTPEELAKASLTDLQACGLGYRDKYVYQTCREIVEGKDLEEMAKLPTAECRKELLKFPGVGPKVADCIMLFSMQKYDAFPVDVWIKRILETLYLKEERSLKEIAQYAKESFGEYAGIAQQYLFFYAREIQLK